MFITSEKIGEIAKALLSVQNEFLSIKKATQGEKNVFADYPQLITKAKPVLSGAGILLMQPITFEMAGDEIKPAVTTILIHPESSEFIKTVSPVTPMTERKNAKGDTIISDEQRVGGGITYIKRYALASILAWATGDYDLDQEILDRLNAPPERKEITPETKVGWKKAKEAYVRDGNFQTVLKFADISEANQKKMIEEIELEKAESDGQV